MKCVKNVYTPSFTASPSMRREWIEIQTVQILRTGVSGLPPCGGSGLKFLIARKNTKSETSPSMRREWIEIQCLCVKTERSKSPSMRREWIEIDFVDKINLSFSSLPPCGGSGLKSPRMYTLFQQHSLPPCGWSGLK